MYLASVLHNGAKGAGGRHDTDTVVSFKLPITAWTLLLIRILRVLQTLPTPRLKRPHGPQSFPLLGPVIRVFYESLELRIS